MTGLLLLMFYIGQCGDACPGQDPVDTGDTGAPVCEIEIDATFPTSGATDADWRTPIEFRLSDPDPGATIETDVPGTLVIDGDRVIWHPDAPLTPSTPYSFTLHYCDQVATLEFTTSDLGLPLEAEPSGEVYALWLPDGRIVRPYGLASIATSWITRSILLGLTADAADLEIVEAFPFEESAYQDTCLTTNLFDMDFSQSPYFEGDDLQFQFFQGDDVRTRVYGALLTGTIAPDGSWIGGMTLSGQTRAVAWSALTGGGGAAEVCRLAASYGESCVPCDHDEEEFCLPVYVDQLVAERVDTAPLVEVAEDCPTE